MKTILVTGGCGFIGTHLVARLINLGYSVIVVDNLTAKTTHKCHPQAQFICANASDTETLNSLLRRVDGCIHLAATPSINDCSKNWKQEFTNNFMPLLCILDTIRQLKLKIGVVYASSAAVYGPSDSEYFTEMMLPRPSSAYGVSKCSCENMATVATQTYGIPTIGLRIFNVYDSNHTLSTNCNGVIARFANQLKRGEPMTIYGDGKQVRDFIEINDVVDCMVLAFNQLDTKQGIFNVCTGFPTSIHQVATAIMTSLGKEVPIEYQIHREQGVRKAIGSPLSAKEILGFSAKLTLDSLKTPL